MAHRRGSHSPSLCIASWGATLFVLVLAARPVAAGPDADALLRRYDAVMAAENFDGTFEMGAHREDGSTRTYTMRVLKSGDTKARLWFSAPVSVRGQEMLRQGENVWVYMPNVRRSLRLGSRDSFQGGDFNNGDVLRVNYASDYTPHADVVPQEPGVVLLDLHARNASAAYDRIKLWLHEADAMPIRAEFYTGSGKLLRRGEYSDYRVFGDLRRPARVVMRNVLSPKRFTTMVVTRFDPHVRPSASQFVLDNLGR